jgi:hypothetical protein
VSDGRRDARVATAVPVTMNHDAGLKATSGTADLSLGGAFLRSPLLLEPHEHVTLELELAGRRIRTHGEVVRVARGSAPGMAVRFTDMSDDDRRALADYLR